MCKRQQHYLEKTPYMFSCVFPTFVNVILRLILANSIHWTEPRPLFKNWMSSPASTAKLKPVPGVKTKKPVRIHTWPTARKPAQHVIPVWTTIANHVQMKNYISSRPMMLSANARVQVQYSRPATSKQRLQLETRPTKKIEFVSRRDRVQVKTLPHPDIPQFKLPVK